MFDYQYDQAALMQELNLTELGAEEQASVVRRVDALLQERVGIRIQLLLEDADKETFAAFTNADEARDFLQEKIPNLAEVYDEEFAGIVEQLKGGLAAAA